MDGSCRIVAVVDGRFFFLFVLLFVHLRVRALTVTNGYIHI